MQAFIAIKQPEREELRKRTADSGLRQCRCCSAYVLPLGPRYHRQLEQAAAAASGHQHNVPALQNHTVQLQQLRAGRQQQLHLYIFQRDMTVSWASRGDDSGAARGKQASRRSCTIRLYNDSARSVARHAVWQSKCTAGCLRVTAQVSQRGEARQQRPRCIADSHGVLMVGSLSFTVVVRLPVHPRQHQRDERRRSAGEPRGEGAEIASAYTASQTASQAQPRQMRR
jgi:hypothetical protein